MTPSQQNPSTVVLGVKDPTAYNDQFSDVSVHTHEGAEYKLPVMNITKLKKALPDNGRVPEGMQCLILVNASFASLSIPFRIIRSVSCGATTLWSCREDASRSPSV